MPASVVLSMMPLSPTAYPLFKSVKYTDLKLIFVPLFKKDQLTPAFVVFKILPERPTA